MERNNIIQLIIVIGAIVFALAAMTGFGAGQEETGNSLAWKANVESAKLALGDTSGWNILETGNNVTLADENETLANQTDEWYTKTPSDSNASLTMDTQAEVQYGISSSATELPMYDEVGKGEY